MTTTMHVPRTKHRIGFAPCARPAEDGRLHMLETAVPVVVARPAEDGRLHMLETAVPAVVARSFMRRLLPCLLLGAALSGTGCSRQPERFFEYESGKINLERITYVTPRIKAGVDEFPLTPEGIREVIANLREDGALYFDVQAVIYFDDFAWRAYRSRTFDPEKSPLTPADINAVERALKKVLARYRDIR